MRKYLGVVNPNAILRGEVQAELGDVFISETEDGMAWHAYQFVTREYASTLQANKCFKAIGRPTWQACEDAVKKALEANP